nr:hypothetical protein CFP56_50315 [Quercus suber]
MYGRTVGKQRNQTVRIMDRVCHTPSTVEISPSHCFRKHCSSSPCHQYLVRPEVEPSWLSSGPYGEGGRLTVCFESWPYVEAAMLFSVKRPMTDRAVMMLPLFTESPPAADRAK